MGLLVGLPMKLFHILFVVLRLAWPLLLGVLIYFVLRKLRRRSSHQEQTRQTSSKSPEFDGPVVDVHYRVVEEDQEG